MKNSPYYKYVLSWFVVCNVLVGCSNTLPANTHYYLLNSLPSHNGENIKSVSHTITVENVVFPDYLTQTNIAMQLDNHQLHYSKQHLWAENLKTSFSDAILHDLNRLDSDTIFASPNSPISKPVHFKLSIKVEHFAPTFESAAILSGTFYLLPQNSNGLLKTESIHKRFYLTTELSEDGFGHAVTQMRTLVTQLSHTIMIELNK